MRIRPLAPGSRRVATLIACAWMALCGAIHSPLPALAVDDARAIRALIGATWDRPESKVETDPVVISGDYAVASWTQGQHGGRALLRRDAKGWVVVLCSGDPLREAGWLAEAGVPAENADRIAADLKAAEAVLPAERRAMFSLFEGVVSGDAAGHHAPLDHDHHSHH
ncbi:copper uptake system-associated protein [Hyphomicrobium sp.]|uniref:copper uptake system-associated protein n=1 Tax=Hyphomicrobium sp. TaxID=82 RepID=UPI0025B9742D|nr:copper uptake system-associated protein [Hyphomicrobium sp.]MCC7252415.1 copper uptake system-associated protein [Hyphomicrobium sp.]